MEHPVHLCIFECTLSLHIVLYSVNLCQEGCVFVSVCWFVCLSKSCGRIFLRFSGAKNNRLNFGSRLEQKPKAEIFLCQFVVCEITLFYYYWGWAVEVEQSLTPHPTQYRSFRRRSSQPMTWLILTNKAVQENKHTVTKYKHSTLQENKHAKTKYKSDKADKLKYSTTKTTLVQSPLTTLGQETRWAYSTMTTGLGPESAKVWMNRIRAQFRPGTFCHQHQQAPSGAF